MKEINNNIDYGQNINPIEENNNKKQKIVIKTYRDFAVESLENKPTSLAKMIIQEKKKKEIAERTSIKNPKNTFLIILSSILALLGIAAIASLILFINTKKDVDKSKNQIKITNNVINHDFKQYYTLDNKDDIKTAIKKNIKNSTIPFGSIKLLLFTEKDSLGYAKLTTAKKLITELDTRVPNQFLRNLKDEYALGITSSLDENNSPFLVLETINFDASFANMLAWEKSMLYDIGPIFNVNQKYYSKSFNDIYLFNKEVRAVLDDEGKLIFAYSFVDSHKIVFFTNNKSFEIILKTLENFEKK